MGGFGRIRRATAPPAGGLWETFDGAKDTSKWASTTVLAPWLSGFTLGGTATQSGGVVTINITADDTANGYSSANTTVDLNDKELIIHLSDSDILTENGTGFNFGYAIDGSENIQWELYNNFGTVTCSAKYNNSGSNGTQIDLTYSATDHAWLRIREAAGDWYWDTAPDSAGLPGTWVNRRQRSVDGGTPAPHFEPASGSFGFFGWGANGARAVAASFDTNAFD